MRIGILTLRHRERPQRSVTPELCRLLREWGVDVTLLHPDDQPTVLDEVVVDQDLYVLMSASALAGSYAGVLHALGGRFLNAHPATVRCRDKVVTTRILHEAGVPVPETFVSLHPAQLASLVDAGPLVVRAPHGAEGRGSHVVWDAEELAGVAGECVGPASRAGVRS